MDYLFLILGIAILVFSGDWIVKGGVRIAEFFNIPKMIVGVTVVSFGTSLPELCVSLSAAISGSADIAIGNVVGSNIANICLVLAISALIIILPISRDVIKRDLLVLLVASFLFTFSILDLHLSRFEGVLLLILMVFYLFLTFRSLKTKDEKVVETEEKTKKHNIWISFLITALSCGGLILGADFLVKGAENIAKSLGVSERIISLTVVAIGTSLPELATSVIAACKKQLDISVGNILGSNIFNICAILGITSCITPLDVNKAILSFDVLFLIGSVILLIITIIPIKGKIQITRGEGALLLALYIAYYTAIFLTGQI